MNHNFPTQLELNSTSIQLHKQKGKKTKNLRLHSSNSTCPLSDPIRPANLVIDPLLKKFQNNTILSYLLHVTLTQIKKPESLLFYSGGTKAGSCASLLSTPLGSILSIQDPSSISIIFKDIPSPNMMKRQLFIRNRFQTRQFV